jgi:hypothetical protein
MSCFMAVLMNSRKDFPNRLSTGHQWEQESMEDQEKCYIEPYSKIVNTHDLQELAEDRWC